jgi:hypothetical protein
MPVEIDKSDRTELKTHFVRNAIPTESNFADLIDAMINQRDDGVAKPPDGPLSIEATANQSKAIDFYGSFGDRTPSWSISLNGQPDPRKTPIPGLAVNDAAGQPQLFLDAKTGALGVGTSSVHSDGLAVSGSTRLLAGSNPIRFTSQWTAFPDAVLNHAEICNDTTNYKTLMIVGNRSAGLQGNFLGRRVSVWDRLEVNGTLSVSRQEAWQPAKFTRSGGFPARFVWTNYGSSYSGAQFFKDSIGIVHLRGMIKAPAPAVGTIVFTLPAGYRPAHQELFGVACAPNPPNSARVDIRTNGALIVSACNDPRWVTLSGITFQAA